MHRKDHPTKYRQHLKNRYGQGFLDALDTVYKKNSGLTLTSIGLEYGTTKFRLSQIFKKLNSMTYQEARRIAARSEEPDKDISRGMAHLYVLITAEMNRKLNNYTKTHGVTRTAVVRECLSSFLEDDAWGRLEQRLSGL